MVDVRERIAAALEARNAHQGRIDEFYKAWNALARCVDTVTDTVAGVAEDPAGDGRGAGDLSRGELRQLRAEIAELTPDIAAVHARFHRPTVNIGVVGQVAAGKSMLLRTISGLSETEIPSGGLKPTTAARSRIQHSPGRADARVILRTWEGFRDGYLQPLHDDAGLGAVPATPDAFTRYPYQGALEAARSDASRGPIDQPKFLQRLLVAQLSFASYRELLERPGHELTIDRLPELRPFIAYPADDGWDRPYHGVQDVWIHCEFQVGGVENLVLVDLPGAGEAALNIEKQFLADLRNQVDVLVQVKRPVVSRSWIGDDDWRVLRLADEASMGVKPADFISFVINTDPTNVTPAQLDNAVAEARSEITKPNDILLLVGNVASADDVQQRILDPVLEHLAQRLAIMDRTAATTQIARAGALAERVNSAAGRVAQEVRRRERRIPSEDKALRDAAKQLRNSVSKQLDELIEEYDSRARESVPVPELAEAITRAAGNLTRWADAGFGIGGKQEWMAKVDADLSADLGETRDDQCTRARRQIREEFGRVDSSLASALDRLQAQVAEVLPELLIAVRASEQEPPLQALAATAERLRLESVRGALSTLLTTQASYGNIFLRVGGPTVDRVSPGPGPLPSEGPRPGPAFPRPAPDLLGRPGVLPGRAGGGGRGERRASGGRPGCLRGRRRRAGRARLDLGVADQRPVGGQPARGVVAGVPGGGQPDRESDADGGRTAERGARHRA